MKLRNKKTEEIVFLPDKIIFDNRVLLVKHETGDDFEERW